VIAAISFIAGLAALIAGGETIVRAGSKLAARIGVSPMIIGLTVVSLGTSAPEMAISINAPSGETVNLRLRISPEPIR